MTTKPPQGDGPAPFARTTLPGRIVFGDGALSQLAPELDARQLRRAMVITSKYDAHLGEAARAVLGDRVVLYWDEVRQHVPVDLANRAEGAARNSDVDVVVTLGGGSTTGLGKAVAVATGLPLAVVPTTYAGSEMTPIYGLTSDNNKRTARDLAALPQLVVYDPQLLTTLPSAIVGPSGMNALAHCAEALWAANADPITDALALDGARRLTRNLPTAYRSDDSASRGELLIAACLAGIALGTVGTSLHHGLCHLLGGMFDAPHAETHAIVLPYAVGYLHSAVPTAAARLAEAIDTTPAQLACRLWDIGKEVGTPEGLKALGLTEKQIAQAASTAIERKLSSPRSLEYAGLHAALHAAWTGEPPATA
ncbi:maleylacetate reductase [Streptomyces sp. NPDC096354]|uniref:maleylacetate reductase n=1 Tax=Streptomyces sp. NPDC096354 TaxID=3366088 RepID=UPI0038201423